MDIKSADDPFLSANLEATRRVAAALVPGKFIVDTIPIRALQTLEQHLQTTDEPMDSTVPPRLVPRDRILGSRQGNSRKVPDIHRWSHGVREERHEGQSSMHHEVGSHLKPNHNHQSGEGFSQSITSDCLSRLEGLEETSMSEEVIRDASGVLFSGGPLSTPRTHTRVSHSHLQGQLIRYVEDAAVLPLRFADRLADTASRQGHSCRRSS